MDDKCCGTCKYHKYENISQGWICHNADSEQLANRMDYSQKMQHELWTMGCNAIHKK